MTDQTPVHVFERAGLGKAPFKCIGSGEKVYQACPGAPVQAGGSCDYCGTAIRYTFTIRSADGRQFIVGSDCVFKTGDAGLRKAVAAEVKARRAAAREAKRQALRAVRQAGWRREGAAKARQFLAAAPELRAALTVRHPILRDMAQRLVRWGNLSERQVAFALKLAAEARAPKAELVFVPVPVTTARQTITATVLARKVQDSIYGLQVKLLLAVDAGEGQAFKLWGSCPRALEVDRGDRVTMAVVFEPSKDDAGFGFYNRPTKAAKLEA